MSARLGTYTETTAGVQQWLVFAFELVRMSWVVIPLCCLAIIYANLKDYAQQKRAVEQLPQNLPRLVLLEGDNIIHDGGGLAFRKLFL